MTNLVLVLTIIIGYIIGSIPWALIVGKVFYGTDIRQYGSGNLGGSNAMRVLSKKAGITVMVLDGLKAFLYMTILYFLYPNAIGLAGLAVCFGHCFPIFAGFKGGKAVATACGYVLALNLYITHELLWCFILPMALYFVTIFTSGYMSLGSIIAVLAAGITGLIFYEPAYYGNFVMFLACFVIFMHRSNIDRLIHGKESNIKNKKNKA